MQAWVVVMAVSACLATSCFSTAKYDRAHEQRVTGINQRYDAERQQVEQRRNQMVSDLEGLKKYLIEIKPASGYSPVERLDQETWYTELETLCVRLKARANAGPGDNEAVALSDQCAHKLYVETYLPALKARYGQADASQTVQLWLNSKGGSDLEALFAYAHNTAILTEIRSQTEQVEALIERELSELEQGRRAEIEASSDRRDQEVTIAYEQRRATLAAIGASLSTLGQNLSRSPAPVFPQVIVGSTSCSSDYNCGYGSRCVKKMYASSGFCAESVNQYGVRSFPASHPGSIGVKVPVSTDCKLPLDCPIAFTCDTGTGACVR